MSAFGGKADIVMNDPNVCFCPKADMPGQLRAASKRQSLSCFLGCKLGVERDVGLPPTLQRYPASRSRAAMQAAARCESSLKVCLSAEVVTGWTVVEDCTTASFGYRTPTP
jgi:hypothetical protein